MPYTPRNAPPAVKRRYQGRCLEVWAQVWNRTMKNQNDEGRAFATAEFAAQQCKGAKVEVEMDDEHGTDEQSPTYEPVAVKFAKGSSLIVEGLAIPYGGPFAGKDFDGQRFVRGESDLCLDWFPNDDRPTLYHHGLNGAIKSDVVGRQLSREETDEGQWIRTELDKAARWTKRVQELVDAEAVGFSSGAMPHLVRTKGDIITRWPWVETSLTPLRSNPYAAAYSIKSAPPAFVDNGEEANDSGPEPFDAQGERVKAALGDFLERALSRVEARIKSGRELSGTNLTLFQSLYERLGEFEDLRRDLKLALDRTDPEARKAIESLEIELLVSDLRRRGVLT